LFRLGFDFAFLLQNLLDFSSLLPHKFFRSFGWLAAGRWAARLPVYLLRANAKQKENE
jgi:hypothetical protein